MNQEIDTETENACSVGGVNSSRLSLHVGYEFCLVPPIKLSGIFLK